MLVSVSLAHFSSARQFGAFGLVFALYLMCLTIERGLVGSVATLRLSQMTSVEASAESDTAMSAAGETGIVLGLMLVIFGISFRGETLGDLLIVMGVALPILCIQDAVRYLAFATDAPLAAIANDAAWTITQVAALLVLIAVGLTSPVYIFASWAISSALGALVAMVVLRIRLQPFVLRRWFRSHGLLIRSLVTEQAFISGVTQGAPLIVGAIGGITSVGTMRAVQTAFGPITTLNTGAMLSTVPEAARRWAAGDRAFYKALMRVGVYTAVFTAVWGAAVLLLPARVGVIFLGRQWTPARDLAVVTAIWLAANIQSAPAIGALRIIGRQWTSATARVVFAPLTLAACAIGVVTWGVAGAIVAMGVVSVVSGCALWFLFVRALRTLSTDAAKRRTADDVSTDIMRDGE